jgi:lantibiotic biosynthesis dehydratase-like protein
LSSAATSEWIEVNVPAPDAETRTRLLLEVVDPLVHDELSDRVRTWFYFWEPELRLRIRWSDPEQAESGRAELARFLDQARADGRLEDWYEGNHGTRGGAYGGEADFYGDEIWELTANDWMSGSELALAIVRYEADGVLTQPRGFHWGRRVHLFSNQLWLDEIALCLRQAHGYLGMTDLNDRRVTKMRSAIEKYLGAAE